MPQNRTKTGKFVKGVSGNPGGRPKTPETFKELVKEKSFTAIENVVSIMEDCKADSKDRLKACEIILAYAYGKPVQGIQMDIEETHSINDLGINDNDIIENLKKKYLNKTS